MSQQYDPLFRFDDTQRLDDIRHDDPPCENDLTECWVDAFMDYCTPPKGCSPQERARWMEQQGARLDDLREAGG